jgi:hypothetical protein
MSEDGLNEETVEAEAGERPALAERIDAALASEKKAEEPKAEEPKAEEPKAEEPPQVGEDDIARFNAAVAELRDRHDSLSRKEKEAEVKLARAEALQAALDADDPVAFVDFLDGLGMSPEKVVDFFMTAGKPTDREALRNKREAQKALKAVEDLKKELSDREVKGRYQAQVDQKHSEVRGVKAEYKVLGKLPDEIVIQAVEATAKAFNENRRDWGGDVKVLMSALEGQLLDWASKAGFTQAEMAQAVTEASEMAPAKKSLIEEADEEDVDQHVEEAKKAVRRRPPSELSGEGSGAKRGARVASNGRHLSLKDRIDNATRKYNG